MASQIPGHQKPSTDQMEADAASAIDMMSLFDQSWRLHQAKYPLPPEYLASAEKIAADVFRNTNFPLPPLRLVVQFLYDRWFERRPYVAPDLNTFSRAHKTTPPLRGASSILPL
jgi:hypothetical protein